MKNTNISFIPDSARVGKKIQYIHYTSIVYIYLSVWDLMINETSCKSPHHTDNKKFVRRINETTGDYRETTGATSNKYIFAAATTATTSAAVVVQHFD